MSEQPECTNCDSTGWVCESHADKPWEDSARACKCGGAGAPCGVCKPCDHDNPPRMPAEFHTVFDKDGWRH